MRRTVDFDSQLEKLDEWIRIAAKALVSCYLSGTGYFIRDTLPGPDSEAGSKTSTNRAFFALVDYLRFLQEESPGDGIGAAATLKILQEVSRFYLLGMLKDPDEVRRSADNDINMFTDGHLLLSVAILDALVGAGVDIGLDAEEVSKVKKSALSVALAEEKSLEKWRGGKIEEDEEVHDFITLHLVRGLDALYEGWGNVSLRASLGDRVRSDVLKQLGFSFAGVTSRFDPAELVFSIALLNRFSLQDAPQLTWRAVQSIIDSQGVDGAWPTARMVSYGKRGLLHVTSIEVALTLTNLLLKHVRADGDGFDSAVLEALGRSFRLVLTTFTEKDGRQGWANDHARWSGHVESWATAIVLTFLLRYRDLLLEVRQGEILKSYKQIVELYSTDRFVWPDLDPILRGRTDLLWSELERVSDPTEGGELKGSLRSKFINPVAHNWIRRPHFASLAISGPPGSRKTSLVRSLAKCLRWPFIILSPPQFLSEGLEGFEANAESIFQDLLRLRRVVILFDECEDFFRLRPSQQRVENRTLGAFITSGMLPRLQSLRDKRWVLFFLATNSPIGELDEAVTRQGRFDFSYNLGYPSVGAQKRYVENKVGNSPESKAVQAALGRFARAHSKKTKTPAISFSLLDKLIAGASADTEEMFSRLAELAGQEGPEELISAKK